MARGKQKKENAGMGQKVETKAERRARLEAAHEARETCMKLLPKVVAAIFLFLLLFALYVRSVPPKIEEVIVPDSTADVVPGVDSTADILDTPVTPIEVDPGANANADL
eukprot:scaffold85724_cov50-Attheya_sp.AAC.8